jgi:RNA polymerase sigma-70 factor (ECF subfamily)
MTDDRPQPEFQPEEYRSYLHLLAQNKRLRDAAGKVDASDVVQECLLKAHEHRRQFAGATEAEYRGWLRRILTNIVLETHRRLAAKRRAVSLERAIEAAIEESGRRLDELLVSSSRSPSKRVATQESLEALLAALDRLPADQQEAVRLRHIQQLSIDEIAAGMHRSAASVAGLLRRGLKELRDILQGS